MVSLCYLVLTPQSREEIGVIYHGQIMLAPVLAAERNDHVILRKHEATHRKENKETENDLTLLISWMLWKFQENSREFYSPVMDIKADPVPEGVDSTVRPAE